MSTDVARLRGAALQEEIAKRIAEAPSTSDNVALQLATAGLGGARLAMLVDDSIDAIHDLVKGAEDEKTKLKAAETVLDRVGLGRKSSVVHEGEITVATDPEIRGLLSKLARKGETFDATPVRVIPELVEIEGEEIEDAEVVETYRSPTTTVLDLDAFRQREPISTVDETPTAAPWQAAPTESDDE